MKIISIIFSGLLLIGCATNEAKPIDVYALQKTALLAYKQHDWQRAHDAYKRLIELNPSGAELWFKLGNIYARMNLPDRSIASYKEALVREPKMSKAWHNIGVVSLRKSTRLFIEMLQHIDRNDPLYKEAQQTGDALIKVLESRRLSAQSAKDYPNPLADVKNQDNNVTNSSE